MIKRLLDAYDRNLAAGYAQIEAAGQLRQSISANSDAMIRAMDEQRAAANTTRTSSTSEKFENYVHSNDSGFDRNMRPNNHSNVP